MIRVATVNDAAEVRRIYAPAVLERATSFELTLPSVEQMGERIVQTLSRYPFLVEQADTEAPIRGFAYASPFRMRQAYQWSTEISIYVDQDRRRQGVGRALCNRLLEILRDQGFFSAYAGIAEDNLPSRQLHQSLGFRQVGLLPAVGYKAGAWRDVGLWQLPLRQPAGPPDPPVWFAQWSKQHS